MAALSIADNPEPFGIDTRGEELSSGFADGVTDRRLRRIHITACYGFPGTAYRGPGGPANAVAQIG